MKLRDIFIIGGLLLAAFGSYFVVESTREEGTKVVIRVDGEIVETYSLSINKEYELKGFNGGINILVIKDGKAYLKDANCPDKLCVNDGSISKSGETITCLPNRVTITVLGGTNNDDVELIS